MRVRGLTQHASHSENLPDTNIVCNHVKGVASFAVRNGRLAVNQGRTTAGCTNVIAQYKLLFGLAARPSAWLQATYDQKMTKLQVLQPSPDAGEHHARISTHLKAVGQPIGANKALTAAHALTFDATLVYGNTEFLHLPGSRVENWLATTNFLPESLTSPMQICTTGS